MNTHTKNNKRFKTTITILLLGLVLFAYNAYKNKQNTSNHVVKSISDRVDLTPSSTTGAIVVHPYYSLSYNERYEQAEWVAYELKKDQVVHINQKRPYFIRDKEVTTKSAHYKAYKNSGYDKGHLCPAGDRRFSKQAYDQTFLTSNISPQKHSFNAGIWNRLEQKTRYWATKYNGVYVITGGVLTPGLKTIGREKVAVPEYFYKIIYDDSRDEPDAIAFLIPSQQDSTKALYEFVTSIDKIEALTGIDFFPKLPDDLENKLEKDFDYKGWSFR